MDEFNLKDPNYKITVYTPKDTVIIQYPLTAQINVTRTVMSDSTRASVQIYNLSPQTRDKIFQDVYTYNQEDWKYIDIEAGYGENLSLIFKGRILSCYSHKQGGATDVITTIESVPFDIFTAQTSHQFAAGTSLRDIHNTIASDLTHCKIANLGNLQGTINTPLTVEGNAFEQLNIITGGNSFVDNGELNTILESEVIDVPVPVISNNSVLLETPRRRDMSLDVTMMFYPDLKIAQLVEIDSLIFPEFNGQFKLVGFSHNLFFSGTQSGKRITTLELWLGPFLPGAVITTTDGKVQNNFNKVKGTDVSPVTPKATISWIWPCKGRISSNYGWRMHPKLKQRKFHTGIDIAVPMNTSVKAVADGKVVFAGWNGNQNSGYGKLIKIDHGKINGKNIQSWYGHLNTINVSQGQTVKQGQVIAKSGMTGYATGPHLHLEARENGSHTNPRKYLKN